MEKQINLRTKSAYLHLRNIIKVRHLLDQDSTKSLVQAFVISRLDMCNSLLANLPKRLTRKLQRVQNSAARTIMKTKRRDHITPVLKELHWLPIVYRINFKILLFTYKCLHHRAPVYLKELISLHAPIRTLRSNESLQGTLTVPHFKKKKHGGRAFSCIAPHLWNSTPSNVRNAESIAEFKTLLKTFYFNMHFNTN